MGQMLACTWEASVKDEEMAVKNYRHESLFFALQSGQIVVLDTKYHQSYLISCFWYQSPTSDPSIPNL